MLEKVASPDLRAVQLYSKADDLVVRRGPQASAVAEELYRRAIAEDPDFASAHIMLAYSIVNQDWNRWLEAVEAADRAMELVDLAPEREAYFIRASKYHLFNEGGQDRQRARVNYEALLRLHPEHFWANSNARFIARLEGGWVATIPYDVRRAKARPNDFDANFDAAHSLAMYGERSEEALAFVQRMLALAEQAEIPPAFADRAMWARLYQANEYWTAGDVRGVQRELDLWTERLTELSGHELGWMRSGLFWARRGLGQPSLAARVLETGPPAPVVASSALLASAGAALHTGDHAETVARLTHEWPTLEPPAALLQEPVRVSMLASAGAPELARRELAALDERNDLRALFAVWESSRPLLEGQIALTEGRPAQAIDFFESVLPEEPRIDPRDSDSQYRGTLYYLGINGLAAAYESTGRTDDAIAILVEAGRQKRRTHPYGKEAWLAGQLELIRLYRDNGWEDEADATERRAPPPDGERRARLLAGARSRQQRLARDSEGS